MDKLADLFERYPLSAELKGLLLDGDAITRLHLRGLLTDSEAATARQRWLQRVKTIIRG